MEHIAAEKGSALEMVQKVSHQSDLAIFDHSSFVFSDSDFLLAEFDQSCFELSDSDDRRLLEIYWGWLLLRSEKPYLLSFHIFSFPRSKNRHAD